MQIDMYQLFGEFPAFERTILSLQSYVLSNFQIKFEIQMICRHCQRTSSMPQNIQ